MASRILGVAGIVLLYSYFTSEKPRNPQIRRLGETIFGLYVMGFTYCLVESAEDITQTLVQATREANSQLTLDILQSVRFPESAYRHHRAYQGPARPPPMPMPTPLGQRLFSFFSASASFDVSDCLRPL